MNNDSNSIYSRMYNNGYLERNNLQGPPGIKGEKGDKGERGIDGNIGLMGPIGPPGPVGPRGPRGMIGEVGYQGIKGEQGERGKEGRVGLKGDIGLQGNTGKKGERGEQGEKGIEGIQGVIGPTGSDGPYGERGPPGIQGEPGMQGFKGDTGDIGATGPDGIRGLQGKDGLMGERGPTGETGPTGLTGPTGTSIIGITGTTNGLLFSVDNSENNNYLISWPNNFVNNSNSNTNNYQNSSVFEGLGYLSTIVGNSYFRLSNNNIPFSEEFSINNLNIIEGNNEEYKIKLNITSSTDYDGQYSNHKEYYKFIKPGMSIKVEGHTTSNNVLDSKNIEQIALFYITEIDLDNLDNYEYIILYAINNKWKTDTSSNLLMINSWYNIAVGYLPKDGEIGPTGCSGIDGTAGATGSTGSTGLTGATGSSIIKENNNIDLDKGYWYRFADTNLNKALNTFYIENNDTKIVINCSLNKSESDASINIISNISDINSIESIRLLYSANNDNSYLEYYIKDNDGSGGISSNNHIILLDSFDNSQHNWNIIDPISKVYNQISTAKNNKDFIKQDLVDLDYKIKILDIDKNQGLSSSNNINANSIDINNNNIIKLSNNVITLGPSMYTQNYQFSLSLLERNSAIKFNCRGNYTYNVIQNISRIPGLNSDFSLGSFSPENPLELNTIKTISELNQETKLNFSSDVNELYKDTFICPPHSNPIFQIFKRENRAAGGGEYSSSLWTIQKYTKDFNYYYQDDIIPEIYRNSFNSNIPQGICFSGNLGIIKNISMNLINDNIYLENINSYSGKIILSNSDEIAQKDINLYIEGYISFRIEIHSFNGIKPYINDTRIQYTNWIQTNYYHFYKDILEQDWNFEQNIDSQNYKLGCARYGDIISIVFNFVNTNTKQSGEIRNQLTDHSDNNKIKYYPYTIDLQSLKFGLNIQNIEIFS